MMNLIFALLFCAFSLSHSYKLRALEEGDDLKEFSFFELIENQTYNQLDKKKEPEDENQNHQVDGAFDGDELLTEEQKKILKAYNGPRFKRQLQALSPMRRWSHGVIPYKFDERRRLSWKAKQNVIKAIQHWEENTCLEFVDIVRSNNLYKERKKKIKHSYYISFGTGNGCSSYVGFTEGFDFGQPINLQEPGCTQTGTIIHEIGHAVGFFHTQSRSDRDNYVVINLKNIRGGKANNFRKMPFRNYANYDHSSTMHYGRKYFGRVVNGQELTTISSKDENLNFLLGHRGSLTYYDIFAANTAYKCSDHCKQKDKDMCHNGGFLFKDCTCVCPEGLTGTNCEEIELSWRKDGCAQIKTLEEDEKTKITTPNYPNSYGHVKCLWLIKAPADKHLKVNLTLKKIPGNSKTHKCRHWVEVRYNRMGQEGLRFCGKKSQRNLPLSTDNMVMVKFDGSSKRSSGRGFMMDISVV